MPVPMQCEGSDTSFVSIIASFSHLCGMGYNGLSIAALGAVQGHVRTIPSLAGPACWAKPEGQG